MAFDPSGTDLTGTCEALSQDICNDALAHLGISQEIADLGAEASVEAIQCRRFFPKAVNETLRAYPWAFATKYATLTWEDGREATPVNGDWTYAFLLPTDCVMLRRLVRPDLQRGPDPDPPPFRLGQSETHLTDEDDVGAYTGGTTYALDALVKDIGIVYISIQAANMGHTPFSSPTWWTPLVEDADEAGLWITPGAVALVFTNYLDPDATDAAPAVEAEYTFRMGCAAAYGDALFKEALAWKLASKLALPLTRDGVKATDAMSMFQALIKKAEATNANEQQPQASEPDAAWIRSRST